MTAPPGQGQGLWSQGLQFVNRGRFVSGGPDMNVNQLGVRMSRGKPHVFILDDGDETETDDIIAAILNKQPLC